MGLVMITFLGTRKRLGKSPIWKFHNRDVRLGDFVENIEMAVLWKCGIVFAFI